MTTPPESSTRSEADGGQILLVTVNDVCEMADVAADGGDVQCGQGSVGSGL